MELIDNINRLLGDDLKRSLKPGTRLKVTASCFSMFAFEALKEELEQVDELCFIFTSPTFVAEEVTDKIRKARFMSNRTQAPMQPFARVEAGATEDARTGTNAYPPESLNRETQHPCAFPADLPEQVQNIDRFLGGPGGPHEIELSASPLVSSSLASPDLAAPSSSSMAEMQSPGRSGARRSVSHCRGPGRWPREHLGKTRPLQSAPGRGLARCPPPLPPLPAGDCGPRLPQA
jgi:hypothetical protein